MAYCAKCGVELDKEVERCPLCNYAVPSDLYQESEAKFPKAIASYEERSKKRKVRIGIVTSFVFILLILTMFLSNIKSSHELSWAKATNISLFLAWISILILLRYKKGKEYWTATKFFAILVIFFILLDLKDGVLTSALTLELSLVIFIYIFALIAIYLYKRLGIKNIFLVIAVYFIIVEILLVFIDIAVGIYLYESFRVTFSLYTLIPMVGLCILSLYFHYDMAEELKESVKRKLHF